MKAEWLMEWAVSLKLKLKQPVVAGDVQPCAAGALGLPQPRPSSLQITADRMQFVRIINN